MKSIFYVIVLIYTFYRAVYGLKSKEPGLFIEPVKYGSDKNYFTPGTRTTISCKGTYKNQKVEWVDPNGHTVQRAPTNRVFVQEHFVSSFRSRVPALVLVFTQLNTEDNGLWVCRSGDQEQQVSLCIIDPSEFVNTLSEVNVEIGRSITLSCQARGTPEPRILWYRNGGELSTARLPQLDKSLPQSFPQQTTLGYLHTIGIDDAVSLGKYEVMTKYNSQGFEGLLTVSSLKPEDSGIYSCESLQESPVDENCRSSQSYNVTLQVNHSPTFADDNDIAVVYGNENESVELVCSANGYPTPTYRWFKEVDDVLAEFPQRKIETLNDGAKAVLIVNTTAFSQRYRCRAINKYGEVDKAYIVLSIDTPKKPYQITVSNSTHDQIQFKVSWHDDIYFPIDEIDVQYLAEKPNMKARDYPTEVDWKKAEKVELIAENSDFAQIENGGLVITLSNLEEETRYWVRLRAANSAGESAWSKPISTSTIAKIEEVKLEEENPEQIEEVTSEGRESESEPTAADDDTLFYGIFFLGALLALVIGCMFLMRLV